jgi:lipopolysaccharide biosynthesis glycosyltransferase
MKYLAYYTIGFQTSYIPVLELSIKSLRKSNPDIDIRILCDTQFKEQIALMVPEAHICERPNSPTPQSASMQKLSVFREDTSAYDAVIFIDSDILVGIPLSPLLSRIENEHELYAFAEKEEQSAHTYIIWSLRNYSNSDLDFFKENNIRVINAGLFAFKPTETMKTHFDAIETMIRNHSGPFFYEQSFMNVYFNTRNLVNYSVFTCDNYSMDVRPTTPPFMILHFCGGPGNGISKLFRMRSYITHTNFFERV